MGIPRATRNLRMNGSLPPSSLCPPPVDEIDRKHRIVLCAQAVGYGPASKLLAIGDQLQTTQLHRVFLGYGVALELAARTRCFDEIIQSRPTDKAAREAIAGATCVLSVMDVDFARIALGQGRPLFVADSLAWIRTRIPPEFLSAQRYWIQNFPDLDQASTRASPKPTVVGPIVSPVAPVAATTRGLAVFLGGYETPYATADDDSGYAEFIVTGLLDSGLLQRFGTEPRILTGTQCARRLQAQFPELSGFISSIGHQEASAARSAAAVVLTAPGLTSTLEAFQTGRPTFFLPPQNYSQWRILSTLRARGLAPASFHWTDRLADVSFADAPTTESRVPIVRAAIRRVTADPSARRRLRESLASIPESATSELVRRQQMFFAELGANGATEIASHLDGFLAGAVSK